MFGFRRSVHPEEKLSAYVDGELGERARRAVERHLASCEACSTLLSELQDTKALLSELPKLELRRSLALGPEFAVERRPAPEPRRSPFAFAPAVALSFLVALLVVDAADFSGGGSSDDAGTFTAASRAAEPEAAGGAAALESAQAEEPAVATDAAAASEPQAGDDAAKSAGAGAGSAAGGAEATGPAADDGEAGLPEAALAPPSGTVTPEQAPEAFAAADEDAREEANGKDLAVGTDDSSGGLSTLRILEIAAAIALAVSLAAVFLPRIVGRSER